MFLIGGAPGVGKSTLAAALAGRVGLTALSIDDLVTAVQAVTTPDTHPGLHLMWKTSAQEYFTTGPVERLIEDAVRQHEATWPFVRKVIQKHALGGAPVVVDGWHLWPSRVAELEPGPVRAAWLVAEPAVLRDRERRNADWLRGSSDPRRMLENFTARSLWFNALFERQAGELGMTVLHQPGNRSVDELCRMALDDPAISPAG